MHHKYIVLSPDRAQSMRTIAKQDRISRFPSPHRPDITSPSRCFSHGLNSDASELWLVVNLTLTTTFVLVVVDLFSMAFNLNGPYYLSEKSNYQVSV
jgi:hypothetical protein